MVTNTRTGEAPKRAGAISLAAYGDYQRAKPLTAGELRRRYESLIADDAAGCHHSAGTWAEMSRQLRAASETTADDLTPGQRSQLLWRSLDAALRAGKARK